MIAQGIIGASASEVSGMSALVSNKTYSESHVNMFNNSLNGASNQTGVIDQLAKVASIVESKFDNNHHQVVQAIKDFDSSGSAVALMQVTHIQANNAVMVQLFGDVGKKTSDETEQLYKQQ